MVLIPIRDVRGEVRYVIKLRRGAVLNTKDGVIKHDDIIGLPPGSSVSSHLGETFIVFDALLEDKIKHFKGFDHATQIIYPRDWGLILAFGNIRPWERIVEIGTGSGAFLSFLSEIMGEGNIISFDKVPERLRIAEKNLTNIKVPKRYELKDVKGLSEIEDESVDVVFMDIPTPWELIDEAWRILRGGGRLIIYIPTFNQVKRSLEKLLISGFIDIRIVEGFVREIQPIPYAIRPIHRGFIFSAYIIFSRKCYFVPTKYIKMLKEVL